MKKQTITEILKSQGKEILDCENAIKEIDKNNKALKPKNRVQLYKNIERKKKFSAREIKLIDSYDLIKIVNLFKQKGFQYKLIADILGLSYFELKILVSKSIQQKKS